MGLGTGQTEKVFTFLLCFLAVAMPNLNLLMSIATILLFLFWVFVIPIKTSLRRFWQNKPAVILAGLYLIHIIWLLNTSDFEYGLKDLRIKLPILILSLVIGSLFISKMRLKWVFLSLSIGVWIATISAYINYFNRAPGMHDHREIVQGVSHIRLSLMVVLQVVGALYFWPGLGRFWRFYSILVITNSLIFLNIIQSSTGFIVLSIVLVFSLLLITSNLKNRRVTIAAMALPVAVLAGLLIFSIHYYNNYFVAEERDKPLDVTTASGNTYYHSQSEIVENGHYTFRYMAFDEMKEAWNKRSDQKVKIGQGTSSIEATLIRYLTSKGLRKDREGVNALTSQDVKNIEMGYPNTIYKNQGGLAVRFHKFMFGLHLYNITGKVSGLSFFQRTLYWDVAVQIIKQHFWLGTGTGDVKATFKEMHREMNPELDKRYWNKSHNQFLTFFVSFGIFGFLYFIFLFVRSFKMLKSHYLALAFLLIVFVSCLSEDTLETQAGVTFFAFFFALFSNFSRKPLGLKSNERIRSTES